MVKQFGMSDEDVDKFLLIIDPLNKNKFTFSDCVKAFN